jgi:hypothetical protein
MARDQVTIRLGKAGLDAIDKLAADTSTNRSAALRALLTEALRSDAIVKAARSRLTE